MNIHKKKINLRKRRHARVRARIFGATERPRMSVFRSLSHIYVQLIDDEKKITLVSASDKELDTKNFKGKVAVAFEVGKLIAKKALEKKIKTVVFDRGGYKYHGRIKAIAEGAREGGLIF
ncbi:MAG: 50S ribosomal protein L18 [Patescibacteria group bacterium]|nr:50S ribosomal protein L18 [Patescibacteria group bacterium]